jgi:cyclopropane-fatty-acyl-phospholipid synthase
MPAANDDKLLIAARALASEVAGHLGIDASVKLWDGSHVALGPSPVSPLAIKISNPGTIASLLRRPTLDRLIRHHAQGDLDLEGGTLIDLGKMVGDDAVRRRLKKVRKLRLARHLLPFLRVPPTPLRDTRDYAGDAGGDQRTRADNKDFISFHYDVGNDFYRLFLDAQMIYSCAYFAGENDSLDQAQTNKLDMICRKLRLKPGDRFLDIGCGWGGLVCHAAKHYGVKAHGITLSEAQLVLARERVSAQGLEGSVTLEIRDYADLQDTYDKIASIGMYEHIGIANIPAYLNHVRAHLAGGGLFLNHGITRRAKRHRNWGKSSFRSRPEQRALQQYIFPGGELDDIGNTVAALERAGFEVHDVEGWRWHYTQTTRIWCERLYARRAEAEAMVGAPTVRIWLAYLAGCSLAFERGSARIFQTLSSRGPKGKPPLPLTRADLYAR